jgi:A/G-specific adenine glycosylase
MAAAGTAAFASTRFAPALLAWFERSGRKHLPWQSNPTAYRVWISEIMLQQTQVATVIPYYARFMARFPDLRSLAAATIDEVLHLWTGLGYYARARNLHRAAQVIVAEHAAEFPDTIEAVQALPGIGRSTAGAILALSGSQRHPILDGNVKRVLARCFGVAGFPGQQNVERELWALAEACTPQEEIASYTQAIMDLGATLCVRSRPLCPTCPLNDFCVARIEGLQSVLPTPRPKKTRPQRIAYAVLALRDDGAVLLERRPPAGIWGGLWTFPQFEDRDSALAWVRQQKIDHTEPDRAEHPGAYSMAPYSHSFTHFDLTLHPIVLRMAEPQGFVADTDKHCWYDPRQPAQIGLAKPSVDLIRQLTQAAQPIMVPTLIL